MSMPLCSLHSKWRGRFYTLLLLMVFLLISCSNMRGEKVLSAYGLYAVIPFDDTDRLDVKWADYLASHLEKRTPTPELVTHLRSDDALEIRVDLNPELKAGFSWQWEGSDVLILRTRDQEQMLWLLYQVIASIGKADSRFDVADLPPASVAIAIDSQGDFPFEYRSIYSPSNRNADLMPILGSGNIDFDWGLWGHNLKKVLGTDLSDDAYALNGTIRDHDQYCFSSPELYTRLEQFILNDYGDGAKDGGSRFVIMPNDNAVVCQCDRCKALGNTETSAVPAVSDLIAKLARRFPSHLFFTSSYASVKEPPSKVMPKNVGVLISAMDLPMTSPLPSASEQAFRALVKRWQQTVNRVYVWDYMRNFDDYLTPYPLLTAVRERLQLYRRLGVRGVIFNGSGEDYASFDDMQTYAISSLMINPDFQPEPLMRTFFEKNYPKSAPVLISYYTSLEKSARQSGQPLPFYGGIADMVKSGFDPESFMGFFNELDKASKKIDGDERKQLNKLLTALNFTALELQRSPLVKRDAELVSNSLENLMGYKFFDEMVNYREAYGSLADYIAYYSAHKPVSDSTKPLTCTNAPELTDRYLGSPYDYHTNWRVSSAPTETFVLNAGKASGQLQVSFLHASVWHIYQPSSVSVWQNGRKVVEAKSPNPSLGQKSEGFHRVTFTLPLKKIKTGQPFELRVNRMEGQGKITTGCDEIELK